MPPSLAYQAMTSDDAWVTVKNSQVNRLSQHCQHCPDFRKQLQVLSDARAVVLPVQSPSVEIFQETKRSARIRTLRSVTAIKGFPMEIFQETTCKRRPQQKARKIETVE